MVPGVPAHHGHDSSRPGVSAGKQHPRPRCSRSRWLGPVPPAPFLRSRLSGRGGAAVGLRAQGMPGSELGLRCLCIAEPLVCAGKVGTCGRARVPLPASSIPRFPPAPGHGRMGSSQGLEPCLCRNTLPAPGSEAGRGNKLPLLRGSWSWVWPGTEDVQAALVGALGELRQFSFSWFKKKGKTSKNSSLRGQTLGWKSLGLLWLCSELPLEPCTPKGGHRPAPTPAPSTPASPLPTNTRNLQPNTGSVKKGLWGILGEIQAPASSAGVGRGWRSRGGSLHPRFPSQ